MDLTLAYGMAQKIGASGTRLDPWQMRSLTHACRAAKESLLSDPDLASVPVVIPSRGSKLIGGATFAATPSQLAVIEAIESQGLIEHAVAAGAFLAERVTAEKPLAMLCHAPAAVLAASEDASSSPFAGYKMTGFSNVEEEQVGLAEGAPWLLEDKLVELGADYSSAAEPWGSHVVVDRNLYTGQNPQSSEELAKRMVSDLG